MERVPFFAGVVFGADGCHFLGKQLCDDPYALSFAIRGNMRRMSSLPYAETTERLSRDEVALLHSARCQLLFGIG